MLPLLLLTACQYGIEAPTDESMNISNFEECINAGNPAMESYPRQCRANGQTFIENIELPTDKPLDLVRIESECTQGGGNWLAEYKECEYLSKEWCDENGGEFKECESACRNDPEAEICTMQCVIVCQF